jgi:hypothetical protein
MALIILATICRHNYFKSSSVSCQLNLTTGAAQQQTKRGQHNTINDNRSFKYWIAYLAEGAATAAVAGVGLCVNGTVRSMSLSILKHLRNLLEDLLYVRARVQFIREGSEPAGRGAEVGRSYTLAVALEELGHWLSWWLLCDCVCL